MLRRGSVPTPGSVAPAELVLPTLAPDGVALRNRLAVPREAFLLRWPGGDVAVEARLLDRPFADGPVAVSFTLAGERGKAVLSAELAARLAAAIGLAGAFLDEAPEPRALLIEWALLDPIQRIEAATGAAMRVLPDDGAPLDPSAVFLDLSLRSADGGIASCGLALPPLLAARFAEALEALAPPAAVDLGALPMTLVVAAGGQCLTLAQIAGLAPGDIVMLADATPSAMLGARLSAVLEPAGPGAFRLTAPFAPRPRPPQQEVRPMNEADAGREGLETVPIGLVFELGRLELPLAELRELGVGSVLALNRTAEEAVDIVANGRRIGRGSLVKIGDGIGVRIVQLASHG